MGQKPSRLARLKEKQAGDEAAVGRWWKRLKRAVAALEKLRKRMSRREGQILTSEKESSDE